MKMTHCPLCGADLDGTELPTHLEKCDDAEGVRQSEPRRPN
jgi:hypothetical protein